MQIVQTCIRDLLNDASDYQLVAYKELKKKNFKRMFFMHQCVVTINFQKIKNANSLKEV